MVLQNEAQIAKLPEVVVLDLKRRSVEVVLICIGHLVSIFDIVHTISKKMEVTKWRGLHICMQVPGFLWRQ
jgi:hypothetical protein